MKRKDLITGLEISSNGSVRDRVEAIFEIPVNDSAFEWSPAFDVKVTPREFAAFIDLPGIDEDELKIRASGGFLIVEGERDFDHDKEDAEEFERLSRPYGTFQIKASIPADALIDDMRAKYKRGVLKIQIPRNRGEQK